MEQEPTPGSQKPTQGSQAKTPNNQPPTRRQQGTQNRKIARKLHAKPTLGKPMQSKVIQCQLEATRGNYREIQAT